ncbi:MoaD/ThiS family protein [Novosphingobium aquae]|uniref:MoaD/ThiS family protein n=1 Tax=Novosphingobium aquae TaxID=3133435 RepID=A0ABU8S3C9_9SPHN
MARVILLPPFAGEFFGGRGEMEVDAGSLFALVRALDAEAPGFAEAVEGRAAIAIGGVVAGDWTTALKPDDEVMFVPKVAGGQRRLAASSS